MFFSNYESSPRVLCQHCFLQNLERNKNIVTTKPDKGNGVTMLVKRFYDKTIQEIISDVSKFKEKLNKEPTLKREASLQCFLRKLKQKNIFDEDEFH